MDYLRRIFELHVTALIEDDQFSYPLDIYTRRIGLYDTLDLIERVLSEGWDLKDRLVLEGQDIEEGYISAADRIVYFKAIELSKNMEEEHYGSVVYNKFGYEHGRCDNGEGVFLGRDPSTNRFKHGELVQLAIFGPDGEDVLDVGIIAAIPLTPENLEYGRKNTNNPDLVYSTDEDSYTVLYGKNPDSHYHRRECFLFPLEYDVSDTTRLMLRQKLIDWDNYSER